MFKPTLRYQLGKWHCLLLHPSAAPAPGFYVGSGATPEEAYATFVTAQRVKWMMNLVYPPLKHSGSCTPLVREGS